MIRFKSPPENRQKIRRWPLFLVFLLFSIYPVKAQNLPVVSPRTVEMNGERLEQIDGLVEQAIADKKMPGAVVLIGHHGKIVYRKAFGNRSLTPTSEKMTVDTIFDLASLTKVVATTTAILQLVERGKIRLSDPISKFIAEIDDPNVKKVTIGQLLTHTGGFRPDFDLSEKWIGREGMLAALKKEKLSQPAGTKFVYSDIGFIVLGEIVYRNTGLPFGQGAPIWFDLFAYYVDKNLFSELKMPFTGFLDVRDFQINDKSPPKKNNYFLKIAPTENIKGQQSYLGSKFSGDAQTGDEILRGRVHDPTAFRMNGIAGHAGLFSTADDLARFCQMVLNGGIIDGKRILSPSTVSKMTAPVVVSETGDTRGLGWDMNTGFSSNRGEFFPLGSFGHTGFTGTGIWIDPVSDTFVIFLSNRVHPDGKGDISEVRARISTIAATAIEDTPVEKFRQAETAYYSQINPQIEKFKHNLLIKRIEALPAGSFRTEIPNLTTGIIAENNIVFNGIDVLEQSGFKELEGLKIGLVTNQTGLDLDGKPTIDVLNEAKNIRLVALFSPEHGIRGELDQEKINDSRDEKTGLPVFSLYGETRRPKPEQLNDLDAIVFDIQDVGTRFYTYIATLKNVLEESAKAGKKVFVLDRPNPINGVEVEGPSADPDKLSFTAAHPIPVRHGMTIGELAVMFNVEGKIGADLKIIQMQNWKRAMWFDQTSQTWKNPSPNMRSLTEATLYPGIGLLETTNLSVGRGTDTPFEVIGAPWLDGRRLAQFLNNKNLPGVRFVPIRFTPNSSVFRGESLGGINIIITNRQMFRPVETGFEIALALHTLFPGQWQIEKYNRLLVNDQTFDLIKRRESSDRIRRLSETDLTEFRNRRTKFLLY